VSAAILALAGPAGTFMGNFLLGMAANAAGQVASIAVGEKKEFSFQSAVLAGVGNGVGQFFGGAKDGILNKVIDNTAIRAVTSGAISNLAVQHVATEFGWQDHIDWRGVATAGAAAGVSTVVGDALKGINAFEGLQNDYLIKVARASVSGFAAGATASLVAKGRIDAKQVALDAFGNALGSSLYDSEPDVLKKGVLEHIRAGYYSIGLGPFEQYLNPNNENISGNQNGEAAESGSVVFARLTKKIFEPEPFRYNIWAGFGEFYDSAKVRQIWSSSATLKFITPLTSISDFSRGYTEVVDLGVKDKVQQVDVTYHFGEGERERLRYERQAMLLQSMGKNVYAGTNADIMGVSDAGKDRDIDARIKAGGNRWYNALGYALSYTSNKLMYFGWNLATAGIVSRHDERIQAEAEGRLSKHNFWRATMIDGITSTASIVAGGRVGSDVMRYLGPGYIGNIVTGGAVGGTFNLIQQGGDNVTFSATRGQAGRSGFSGTELLDNALTGAALGYGGKLLADYGHYNIKFLQYRPGTLYSNPLPFELVAPNVPNTTSVDLFRKTANTGEFAGLKVPMQMRYVEQAALEGGVGLQGVKVRIVRDPELLGKNLYGYTHPNGSIDLYPDAFTNTEQLVKTLGHERTHTMQIDLYGHPNKFLPDHLRLNQEVIMNEKAAHGIEDSFWRYYQENKTGRLGEFE